MYKTLRISTLLLGLLLTGCATVGHRFPTGDVAAITIGETTQREIQDRFGSPWRTGIEDGLVTWTYGHYRYRLFKDAETEDLLVRFNAAGVVVSYAFNTTKTGEGEKP